MNGFCCNVEINFDFLFSKPILAKFKIRVGTVGKKNVLDSLINTGRLLFLNYCFGLKYRNKDVKAL